VKDLSAPQLVAHRDLNITVSAVSHVVRVTAGPHGTVRYTAGGTDHTVPPGTTAIAYVPHGESQLFTMEPDPCFDTEAVIVTEFGVIVTSQKVAQYLLTDVRSDGYEIAASFQAVSLRRDRLDGNDAGGPRRRDHRPVGHHRCRAADL
jgi:hypothetical protein